MLILIILIFLLIGSIIWASAEYWDSFASFFTVVIVGILLLLHAIMWPISYYSTKSACLQFEQLERDALVRGNAEDYAFKIEITKANQSLIDYQYWNTTWIGDPYMCDCVDALSPVYLNPNHDTKN